MTESAVPSPDAPPTAPLDTYGAPVTFTGDLLWLHPLTDANGVARHVHETVVIVFFRDGSGSHDVAGHARRLSPGDVVIVPPGAAHDLTRASGLVGWALEFSPAVLRHAGRDADSAWWSHPLLQPYVDAEDRVTTASLNVAPEDRGRWEELLVRMARELDEQRTDWSQAATACLLLLLVEVVRALEASGAEPRFHADPTVTAALAVVERRFAAGVNVAGVAATVGTSPEHLTTVVRRATGRTLGQWISGRRMAEARRLLATTNLPLEAVARHSGYADAAHFNRRFRQLNGVPPGAWRARHR